MPRQTTTILSEEGTHAAIKAVTKRATIVSLIVSVPISVVISLYSLFLSGRLAVL